MYAVPDNTGEQVDIVESIDVKGGIYARSIVLDQFVVVPQHRHPEGCDHATLCGEGAARLWVDGEWVQDLNAGDLVEIKGGHDHLFQALAPGKTRLVCLWREDVAETMLKGY